MTDSLLTENQKKLPPRQRFRILIEASKEQYFKNTDKSLKLSDEALSIAQSLKNDSLIAVAYVSKSYAYQLKDATDECMEFAMKALALSEKVKLDPNTMATVYRKLGYVYYKQKKYEAGIDVFKKAYEYSVIDNNQMDMAGTLGSLGLFYERLAKYEMALKYLNQAQVIAKKIKNYDIAIRNQINLIRTYDKLNDNTNAFKMIEETSFLFEQKGVTPFVKCLASTVIADFDLRKGKPDHKYAQVYLSKMDEYLKTTKVGNDNLSEYYLAKSLLEFSRGATIEGSKALEKYHEHKAIFENEILKGHSQELATKYETGKKDALIKTLNIEKELKRKEQELSEIQKKGAIILAVLLGILAFSFYNRFRLKKKTSEELAVKNIEIEKQKELIQASLVEKETLLREIHHRVKNNLQIISSLLNFQSESIEDTRILSSIKDGQARIQAMSLIHQNLYQSENINQVNIENYIKELVGYLVSMYSEKSNNVNVKIAASNIFYEIETAIPLGLIVNELVSNAFKYAFDKGKGEIYIEIQHKESGENVLIVKDNGKGILHNFELETNTSLGLKLVKILSRQMRGKVKYRNENGAVFEVIFKPQPSPK